MTASRPVPSRPTRPPLPWRAALAVRALGAGNRLSRWLGRGSGTVAGGRIGLAVDPALLATLARGRQVALVTGTNGKTTTTGLMVAALTERGSIGTDGGAGTDSGAGAEGGNGTRITTNTTGANMPAGHVAALAADRSAGTAVLEVDEGYLGQLIEQTGPVVVVLLNLSRDQLDRISEVRMLVDRWRAALGAGRGSAGRGVPVVVANADDPMVAWAALPAPDVRWVGAGQVWHQDAVGCPACGGRIVFADGGGWQCDSCELARPRCDAWLEDDVLVLADGSRHPVAIDLPGRFNRANAAMVAVAAPVVSASPLSVDTALARMSTVGQVAGRFSTVTRQGRDVRLLLAKNPAGWTAIFDLLDDAGDRGSPIVLSVNARIADGLDTSWLWDVPFERLAGRRVVATGERCRDLAVRLRYAEVDHIVVPDPVSAVDAAMTVDAVPAAVPAVSAPAPAPGPAVPAPGPAVPPPVEFLGNYTAFAWLRSRL